MADADADDAAPRLSSMGTWDSSSIEGSDTAIAFRQSGFARPTIRTRPPDRLAGLIPAVSSRIISTATV